MRVNKTLGLFFILMIFIVGSCCSSDTHNKDKTIRINDYIINNDLALGHKNVKVGAVLFRAILDTIALKHLDFYFLVNNGWQFKVSKDQFAVR